MKIINYYNVTMKNYHDDDKLLQIMTNFRKGDNLL
jgi:hypothetical protein